MPLTIRILAAVAQEEREQISKRVKAALDVTKEPGVKLGGAHRSKQDAADVFAQSLHTHVQAIMDSGAIGLAAIARAVNERGARSPWCQMGSGQVVRLLR